MKQVYQKGRTHKFSQKKDQNTCIRAYLNRKVGKTTFSETKNAD